MLFYVLTAAMRLKGRVDSVHCSLQRWVQSGPKSGHTSAFQLSHSSVLAKGVQYCQVFSMASASPFLGAFFLLGPTILITGTQPRQGSVFWLGFPPSLCTLRDVGG